MPLQPASVASQGRVLLATFVTLLFNQLVCAAQVSKILLSLLTVQVQSRECPNYGLCAQQLLRPPTLFPALAPLIQVAVGVSLETVGI